MASQSKDGTLTSESPDTSAKLPSEKDDVAALYMKLTTLRDPYLDRARENAEVTIPALMPPEGMSPGEELKKPYQSLGAHGVNTLTAKLVSTLMPLNNPMFRFAISDSVIDELTGDEQTRAEYEKKLNEVERKVQDEIESLGARAAIVETIKHLLVAGNVLMVVQKNGQIKLFRLDRYVVQRDSEGNLLRVIVKESLPKETLPAYVQKLLAQKIENPDDDTPQNTFEKSYDLYTVYERRDGRMHTYQSIKGIKLEKSKGSWPLDKSPVMPLRWNYMHDEDYGRSYVGEYYGDLKGLEALSRALREAAAASAKINPMVNPNGLTRIEDVVNAENLEVISGRPDDIGMLQFEKQADMQIPMSVAQDLTQRIQHAFMMAAAIQRNAERVTAEEIRTMINDLESVLGGAYSLLAREFQKPFVMRMLDRFQKMKLIPNITDLKTEEGKIVDIKVITGVEALGRGQDYSKYRTYMAEIVAPAGPEGIARINLDEFFKRAAVSLNIDDDGLIKSKEQMQEGMQQNLMQRGAEITQDTTKEVAKAATGPATQAALENLDPEQIQQLMQQMGQQQPQE